MTRPRVALEFLVLLTLASLAMALSGCSNRRWQPPPEESASSHASAGATAETAPPPIVDIPIAPFGVTPHDSADAAAEPIADTPVAASSTTAHEFGRIGPDGRYVAPDGSFSVGPPHAPTSFEFQNMRYTDGTRASETLQLRYVIFGPGPSDPTAYHVVVAAGVAAAGDAGSAPARTRAISDAYMRRYAARHGGSSELVAFEQTTVAGHAGSYAVYRHDPPAPDGAAFYVVFTITDHGDDRIVNVMAEKLTPANPWYPGREALLAGTWTRFNDFAASVRIAGE